MDVLAGAIWLPWQWNRSGKNSKFREIKTTNARICKFLLFNVTMGFKRKMDAKKSISKCDLK
jgi:hypothetical protein